MATISHWPYDADMNDAITGASPVHVAYSYIDTDQYYTGGGSLLVAFASGSTAAVYNYVTTVLDDFTIHCQARYGGFGEGWPRIMSYGTDSSHLSIWPYVDDGVQKISLYAESHDGLISVDEDFTVPATHEWVHFAFCYDSTEGEETLYFLVNGVVQHTQAMILNNFKGEGIIAFTNVSGSNASLHIDELYLDDEALWTGDIVLEPIIMDVPQTTFLLSGNAPTYELKTHIDVQTATIRIHPRTPARLWDVPSSSVVQQIYTCILEPPSGVDLPVLHVPISNIQARIRDGAPTYLSVVLPSGDDTYIQAIEARQGTPGNKGKLVVFSGVRTRGGQVVLEELIRTNLETFRFDKGARSASITLVGYVVSSNTASKWVTVRGVSVESLANDGKRRITCEPSFFIKAGDVATWDGKSMIVGLVSLNVTTRDAQMTLSER